MATEFGLEWLGHAIPATETEIEKHPSVNPANSVSIMQGRRRSIPEFFEAKRKICAKRILIFSSFAVRKRNYQITRFCIDIATKSMR